MLRELIYFTINEVKKSFCYTEDFVIKRFVISRHIEVPLYRETSL